MWGADSRVATLSRMRQRVLRAVEHRTIGTAPSRDQHLDVMVPFWQSLRSDQRDELATALHDLGFDDKAMFRGHLIGAQR